MVDADIQGFFDSIPHGQLREVLHKRVHDEGMTRQIGKWLNAGVMEDGSLSYPEKGTPQGGRDLAAAGEYLPPRSTG